MILSVVDKLSNVVYIRLVLQLLVLLVDFALAAIPEADFLEVVRVVDTMQRMSQAAVHEVRPAVF